MAKLGANVKRLFIFRAPGKIGRMGGGSPGIIFDCVMVVGVLFYDAFSHTTITSPPFNTVDTSISWTLLLNHYMQHYLAT